MARDECIECFGGGRHHCEWLKCFCFFVLTSNYLYKSLLHSVCPKTSIDAFRAKVLPRKVWMGECADAELHAANL